MIHFDGILAFFPDSAGSYFLEVKGHGNLNGR